MKSIEERFAVHLDDYKHYDTEKLRKHFLIETLFKKDEAHFVYTHYDRMMIGGAMPVKKTVALEPVDQQKATHFLDRRELGAINIGGEGTVNVDGTDYKMETKTALYVGRGAKNVTFASTDPKKPAKFYMNSAPAHQSYPTKKVGMGEANVLELGASETCNERRVNQMLINGIIETCQLQMGMTELQPGSIWNTMPFFLLRSAGRSGRLSFYGPQRRYPAPLGSQRAGGLVAALVHALGGGHCQLYLYLGHGG